MMDQDLDTIPDDAEQQNILNLTEEKWVVVLAEDSPHAEQHQLADSHVDSKILPRIRLHNDKDTWMVLLITLVGPCFEVYNKD